MNIITLLFITYLITPFQIKCQVTCPPGSDTTETINLDGSLVNNDPAITSELKGGSTECAGTQEIDGWSFTNDGNCANSNDKVNWYFMGALNDNSICKEPPATDPWYECITPDIVNSGPGEGPNGYILVECLQQIEFTLHGTISADSGIFIEVYTKPQQDDVIGINSLRCWYKSRLHIRATSFNPEPQGATFNQFTTFTSDILNAGSGYAPLGTGNGDSNSGDNTNTKTLADILATEEIRAIAFSTDSAATANTHDWTLLDFKLTFGNDCTCPTSRTYNLAAVPGPFSGIDTIDIGNDCSNDIGTCAECTCKYKCIHQDGVEGNIQQVPNLDSQDSCCALCGETIGCLAYTYILHISGVSSECGDDYAINDCLLYNNKLTECNTDLTQMRYESVSGSIVNGICNINSIVGDCCEGNGECITGMCT